MREAVGDDALAEAALACFGITEAGNFEGANAPVRATSDPEALPEIKARMRACRERRAWPALDDKRLTSWNALMISALADAGAALERADYRDAAIACAEFILRDLRDADGRLLRTYNRGEARLGGYLEDHAYLLEALLTLYEATFDPRWFARGARAGGDRSSPTSPTRERGGFFSTADDHERLVARRKDLEDTPIPSGASAAAYGLLRLARADGRAPLRGGGAPAGCGCCTASCREHPAAFGHCLQALDFLLAPVARGGHRRAGRGAARARGAGRVPAARRAGRRRRPTACRCCEGRAPVDGRAAAYVCERFTCRRPVTEPGELASLLE